MLNHINSIYTMFLKTMKHYFASILAKGKCWKGCKKTNKFINS